MLKLDDKEQEACDEILNACEVVSNFAGIDSFEYYFEVRPSSIGQTITLVVPEYNISKNITNYDNW